MHLAGVGVAERDGEDLLVGLAAVDEVEEADGTGLDEASGEGRDRAQHEDVERVAVIAQGAGDEAVVTGIVDGAVEHAVEAEHADLLVELVLVALVGGNLDDRGDLVGRAGSGRDVVPGVKVPDRWTRHRCSGSEIGGKYVGQGHECDDRTASLAPGTETP